MFVSPVKMSVCVLSFAIASSGLAGAATISVDFASAGQAAFLSGADSAGAPGYSAVHWNVVTGNNTASASPALPLTLVNDSGVATTATLDTFNSVTSTAIGMPATPSADQRMFGGFIQAYYTNGVNAVVSNIPFAAYDVVVYVESDSGGRTGSVQLSNSATSYYYATVGGGGQPASYIQVTSTSDSTYTTGNYMVFTHLTSSSFTLQGNQSNWSGITGFQIVQVPEPASLGLIGVATPALITSRRCWVRHFQGSRSVC